MRVKCTFKFLGKATLTLACGVLQTFSNLKVTVQYLNINTKVQTIPNDTAVLKVAAIYFFLRDLCIGGRAGQPSPVTGLKPYKAISVHELLVPNK